MWIVEWTVGVGKSDIQLGEKSKDLPSQGELMCPGVN